MKAIILAGGLGTRLKDYYPNTIKSLIEFNKKPFIYYQLELLKRNGFNDIIICSGYGSEKLEKYIYENNFNIKIKILNDGEKLLGTGGAIKKALPFVSPNFMVLYGDSYLDFNYKNTINKFILSNKLALMTIYKNKNKFDKSNIRYNNNKIISYNKINPNNKYKYIDYGANFFNIMAFIDTPEIFDLSKLQQDLLQKNNLDYDIINERFYEIGSVEGIKEFEEMINRDYVY